MVPNRKKDLIEMKGRRKKNGMCNRSRTDLMYALARVHSWSHILRMHTQRWLHSSMWRYKHRCDANYAKGQPRCFAVREPKLSLFHLSPPRMFPARPIPVVNQPVLPIALKFQIISLSRGAGCTDLSRKPDIS